MDEIYKKLIIDIDPVNYDSANVIIFSCSVIVVSIIIWQCRGRVCSKTPVNSSPLLPPCPKHKIQNRSKVVEAIRSKFAELSERCPDHDTVMTVYLEGPPGFGKTQAARLFANEFYDVNVSDFFSN